MTKSYEQEGVFAIINEERTLMYMLFRENEELRKLVDKPDAEWKFKDADTCSARYECSNCGYIHTVYCAETMLVCDKCGNLMRNPRFIARIKEMIDTRTPVRRER